MRVLVARGRIVSLLSVQERGRELLVLEGPRVAAIRTRDRLELLVRRDRWCATIVSSLNT